MKINWPLHPARGVRSSSLLCALIFLAGTLPVAARMGTPPPSLQRRVQPLGNVKQRVLSPTDVQAELAADAKRGRVTPLRFAVPQQMEITPANDGTWEDLPDGRLWRLRVYSAGATDLNLGFTTFWLPEGATLHVSAEKEDYFQGPYTARDNKPHGQLWTPVVPGDAAVIELFVPTQAQGEPRLVLSQVATGYRDFFRRKKDLSTAKAAGPCNNDVVCPAGAPWRNEIRSVGVYTLSGEWTCTGTLIANVAGDFKNYFLTANHCEVKSANAAAVVVYWNHQSTNCGTHGPGSLAQNQSGAIFRAAKSDVDFCLLELDDVPDPAFKVFYSGWDWSGAAPTGCVGIHHPDCDVKAISFSSKTLTTVNSCIGTGGSSTHWQVTWYSGVTEPGSSGSGIWDPTTRRLVGTLSGGDSSCDTPYDADCYGKISVAWSSGKTAASRLRDWLDPQNTGVTFVSGVDPALPSIIWESDASLVSESCPPGNNIIDPGETVTVSFALTNSAGLSTSNLVATLLSTNGVTLPSAAQTYGALTVGGLAVSRSFAFTASGNCGGTIIPTLQLQDDTRNLGTVTFNFALGVTNPGSTVIFSQNFDGVPAPNLPAGWTTSGGTLWVTSTAQRDTLPNAVFVTNLPSISDNSLASPAIAIGSTIAQLTFRHRYLTETNYDGGVLEISLGGGAFTDILNAGSSFVTNGYNRTLSSSYGNPLAGRQAWSGNSAGFITTKVNLPSSAAGQNIRLRWRFGSDDSENATGWYVDTISISEVGYTCCTALVPPWIVDTRLASDESMAFSYDSVVGQTYFVETKTDLSATNWTPVRTNSGDGSRQSYTNSTTESAERYFRVRTQ